MALITKIVTVIVLSGTFFKPFDPFVFRSKALDTAFVAIKIEDIRTVIFTTPKEQNGNKKDKNSFHGSLILGQSNKNLNKYEIPLYFPAFLNRL